MDLVEALVTGRRGRRLLLEFALACEQERFAEGNLPGPLGNGFFDAAYLVSSRRGDAVVRFVLVREDQQTDGADSEPAMPSDEELVALLQGVRLGPADPHVLRRALADSVERAMYWGPADGEDTILQRRVFTSALRRIARHVVVSGTVAGWGRPCDVRDQWMITWDSDVQEEEPARAKSLTARQLLNRWKEDIALEERQHRKDLDKPMRKLASGPWWSTPPWGIASSSGSFEDASPVGLGCVEDSFGWREARAQKIEVHDKRPVFEVTGPEAWAQLCRDYPMEVSAIRRRNWFDATGRDGRWVIPDWSEVARDYAGVHLPTIGYLACAGEVIPVDADAASLVAGWAPDSTYWLTDRVEPVGNMQRWILPNEPAGRDEWVRSDHV